MSISKLAFKDLVVRVLKIRTTISSLEKTEEELKPKIVSYLLENGKCGKEGREETDDRLVEVDDLKIHNCLQEKSPKLDEDRVREYIRKVAKQKQIVSSLIVEKEVLDETQFEKLRKDGTITEEEIEKYAFLKSAKPSYRLNIYSTESGFCAHCLQPVFRFDKYCSSCGQKTEGSILTELP